MERGRTRPDVSRFLLEANYTAQYKDLSVQGPIAVRLCRQANDILEECREEQPKETISREGIPVRVSHPVTIETDDQTMGTTIVDLRLKDILDKNRSYRGIALEASFPGSPNFTTLFSFRFDGTPHIRDSRGIIATEAQKEIAQNLIGFMQDELGLSQSA